MLNVILDLSITHRNFSQSLKFQWKVIHLFLLTLWWYMISLRFYISLKFHRSFQTVWSWGIPEKMAALHALLFNPVSHTKRSDNPALTLERSTPKSYNSVTEGELKNVLLLKHTYVCLKSRANWTANLTWIVCIPLSTYFWRGLRTSTVWNVKQYNPPT